MTDLERLAARLIQIHEDSEWHYDYQGCFFCSGRVVWDDDTGANISIDPEHPHDTDCPFGMALAWKMTAT